MVLMHAPFWLLERAKVNIDRTKFLSIWVADSASSFSVGLLTVWPACQENQVGTGREFVDVHSRIMSSSSGEEL